MRFLEIDGAADAMTSIRDKVEVAITGSGIIYKRGEVGVNSAIGMDRPGAGSLCSCRCQWYVLSEVLEEVVSTLWGLWRCSSGKLVHVRVEISKVDDDMFNHGINWSGRNYAC